MGYQPTVVIVRVVEGKRSGVKNGEFAITIGTETICIASETRVLCHPLNDKQFVRVWTTCAFSISNLQRVRFMVVQTIIYSNLLHIYTISRTTATGGNGFNRRVS